MDLIKISDTKLKIMLTSADMTRYDLHSDGISIADQHVRTVLKKLLEDAREQTGFDADTSRLFVQMYPSADGGCELFVSKEDTLESASPFYSGITAPLLPKPITQARSIKKFERHGRDMCAYSFTNLEQLICVCKRLGNVGFPGKSKVYTDTKHTYYLFLWDFSPPSLYSIDEYCFLGEYGSRENARTLQTYIGEYGTLICDQDAVSTLSQL